MFSSRLRTDENPSQGKKLPIEQGRIGLLGRLYS